MGPCAFTCIHSFACGGFTQDIFYLSLSFHSVYRINLRPSAPTIFPPSYPPLQPPKPLPVQVPSHTCTHSPVTRLCRPRCPNNNPMNFSQSKNASNDTYWDGKGRGPAFGEQTCRWLTWSSGSQRSAGVWLKGEYRHGACHQKQQPCLSMGCAPYSAPPIFTSQRSMA